MSWDLKKGGQHRYYYRCERRPGHPNPVKVYLGKGPQAEEAARQLEERRLARQARREADRETLLVEQIRYLSAEKAVADLQDLVDMLVREALHEAGYHEHRGEWRRKRHGQEGRSDRER